MEWPSSLGFALPTVGHRYPAALEQLFPRAIVNTPETLELDRFAVDPLVALAPSNTLMPPSVDMAQYPAVHSLSVGSFRGRPLDHLQHFSPTLDGTLQFDWLDPWVLAHNHDDVRAGD